MANFLAASSFPQPYTSHQKLNGTRSASCLRMNSESPSFLLELTSDSPMAFISGVYPISSYDHPVSMLCLICPRRSSQQRVTMAESGIMHRSFRAVSLTMELRSDSITSWMKGSSVLLMFVRRHSSSSLRWLAGSLFQSFLSSSRAAAGSCCLNLASISLRSPWVAVSQESVAPHSSPERPICLISHKPLFPTRFFSSLRSSNRNGLLRS